MRLYASDTCKGLLGKPPKHWKFLLEADITQMNRFNQGGPESMSKTGLKSVGNRQTGSRLIRVGGQKSLQPASMYTFNHSPYDTFMDCFEAIFYALIFVFHCEKKNIIIERMNEALRC